MKSSEVLFVDALINFVLGGLLVVFSRKRRGLVGRSTDGSELLVSSPQYARPARTGPTTTASRTSGNLAEERLQPQHWRASAGKLNPSTRAGMVVSRQLS